MTEQTPYRLRCDTPGRRFLQYGSIGLAVWFVALNWWTTQSVAFQIGFPANLNGHIVGHLYQPFAWWVWAHRWPTGFLVPVGDFGVPIERIWKACERFVIYPSLVLGIIGGAIAALLNWQEPPADLHGSASWANTDDIQKAELL